MNKEWVKKRGKGKKDGGESVREREKCLCARRKM